MSLTLVHEQEIQRQHVRVRIPARVRIAEREYALRDLSVSGAALEQVETAFAPGQQIALTLMLSFAGFSFHANLKAHVEYFNRNARTMGCRFDSLSNEQLSLLSTIIKSYMSGVVVTQEDLLNVVARDNFMKLRGDAGANLEKKTPFQLLQRALPALAAALLGCAAFGFAGANMYEKFTVLKAPQASVKLDMLLIRSMADGVFKSALPEGAQKVVKGQALGVIAPVTGFAAIPLTSPCDCAVAAPQSIVTVKPDRDLPYSLSGRPARVSFYLK
jgi:alginate biosynthesis protein Alg44